MRSRFRFDMQKPELCAWLRKRHFAIDNMSDTQLLRTVLEERLEPPSVLRTVQRYVTTLYSEPVIKSHKLALKRKDSYAKRKRKQTKDRCEQASD